MNYKFTKNDTLTVKGVAIFFLLCYHCFSSVDRLYGAAVSFWPLSQEAAMAISRCMIQCVGMFAFLSVYGLTLSLKKQYEDYEFTGKQATGFVVKRYLHLIFTFLIPYFFCFFVTYGFGYHRYNNGTWANIFSMLTDIFCVGRLTGSRMLIPTWWYLSLEVILIVFLPFAVRFYKKYSWLTVLMVLVPGSFLIEKHSPLTMYLFTVPLAVCFADQHVFERLKAYEIVGNKVLNKVLKFLLSTVPLLVMCGLFDSVWGIEHFEFLLNGLIPVFVIYWVYEFIVDIPGLHQCLEFIGKHSGDIFYTHTFVRGLWWTDITYSFGQAWQIFLFVLLVSLAISVFYDVLRKLLRFNQITGRFTGFVLNWIEKTI